MLNYKNFWGWIWSLWRRWCVLFSERIASNALDLQAAKLFGATNPPRERMMDHDWPLIHNKGRVWTLNMMMGMILYPNLLPLSYTLLHVSLNYSLIITVDVSEHPIQWPLLLDLCDMYMYIYIYIYTSICFMNFIGSTCINDGISQPFTARSRRADSVCSSPGRTRTSGSLGDSERCGSSYLPWKTNNLENIGKYHFC